MNRCSRRCTIHPHHFPVFHSDTRSLRLSRALQAGSLRGNNLRLKRDALPCAAFEASVSGTCDGLRSPAPHSPAVRPPPRRSCSGFVRSVCGSVIGSAITTRRGTERDGWSQRCGRPSGRFGVRVRLMDLCGIRRRRINGDRVPGSRLCRPCFGRVTPLLRGDNRTITCPPYASHGMFVDAV